MVLADLLKTEVSYIIIDSSYKLICVIQKVYALSECLEEKTIKAIKKYMESYLNSWKNLAKKSNSSLSDLMINRQVMYALKLSEFSIALNSYYMKNKELFTKNQGEYVTLKEVFEPTFELIQLIKEEMQDKIN